MTRRRSKTLVPCGQLAFDDCTPDWPAPQSQPRPRASGTGYYLGPQSDLRGQRLGRRGRRIVTVPITREYL